MKISNKLIDLIEQEKSDTTVQSFQSGGSLSRESIYAPVNRERTMLPSKQEGTVVKLAPQQKPAGQFVNGQYVNNSIGRDNGTVSAYNKSPREKLMSSIYKVADVGNGALTGIVAQPALSATKLLRPDKYFDGVQSDSDVGRSVGEMAGDVLAVAPVAPYISAGAKMVGSEAKQIARATADAFEGSLGYAKDTYRATSDLPFAKRVRNAAYSGSASKSRIGDVVDHKYFHMSPEEVSRAMVSEKIDAPRGAVIADFNMSANSSPLYWAQTAKDAGGAKTFTTVRTGGLQEVNNTGVNGKRVSAAFSDAVTPKYNNYVDEASGVKEILDNSLASGKINREMYNSTMDNLNPNRRMFRDMHASKNSFPHLREWFENYKPTMDKGIEMVNANTGLNFPMTTIKGASSGNAAKLRYVQPTALSIKGGGTRVMQTLRSNLADIPRHYQLNKVRDGALADKVDQLKGRLQYETIDRPTYQRQLDYLHKDDNSKTLDQLLSEYEDGW